MGRTTLTIACELAHTELAELLLVSGAKIIEGLLTMILQAGNIELAQLLVTHGADIDVCNFRKETFLGHACAEDMLPVVNFLIDNKCNIDATGVNGTTALMCAANAGHIRIVKKLLEHNASVSMISSDGRTALHVAVDVGSSEIVGMLLEKVADPLAAQRHGTPLDIAINCGETMIEKQLVEYLEDNDRVEYDDRWPGLPLYLSLEAIKHDYEIMDHYGRPIVRPLTERLP